MLFHSHALEQFITRYDPTLTHDQALAMLERAARYKAEPTRRGERYWDVPELGVRLIVKLEATFRIRDETIVIARSWRSYTVRLAGSALAAPSFRSSAGAHAQCYFTQGAPAEHRKP